MMVYGAIPGEESDNTDVLIRELRDGTYAEKANAALLLGQRKEVSAIPLLINNLCSAYSVQEEATSALIHIGDASIGPIMEHWNDERPEYFKDALAYILSRIGGEPAFDALLFLLKDSDNDPVSIINALMRIRTVSNNGAALRELHDINPLKGAMSPTIESSRDERLLNALISQMENQDATTRANVVEAIAEIGGKNVVELLLMALYDNDFIVSNAAYIALKRIGPEHVDNNLIMERVEVERIKVKEEALKLIQQLEDAKQIGRLIQSLSGEDLLQRKVAERELDQFDINLEKVNDFSNNFASSIHRLARLMQKVDK